MYKNLGKKISVACVCILVISTAYSQISSNADQTFEDKKRIREAKIKKCTIYSFSYKDGSMQKDSSLETVKYYDTLGNLLRSEFRDIITVYEYNILNKPYRCITSTGNTVISAFDRKYDSKGNNVEEISTTDEGKTKRIQRKYIDTLLKEENEFSPEGELYKRTNYTYTNQRLLKSFESQMYSKVLFSCNYEYDILNRKTRSLIKDYISKTEEATVYKYHVIGSLKSSFTIAETMQEYPLYIIEKEYNGDGRILIDRQMNFHDTLEAKTEYEYNASGFLSYKTIFQNSSVITSYLYRYDKYGNLTKINTYDKNDKPVNTKKYYYEYYK